MEKFMYFDSSVLENQTFEQFDNTVKDLLKDRFEGTQKAIAEESVRHTLLKLFGLNEETVKDHRAYRRAVRDNATKFFDYIEEIISVKIADTLASNPFLNEFAEIKTLGYADTAEFWIEDDTQEIWVAEYAGDHHDLTLQQVGGGKSIVPPRKRYVAAVGTNLRQYLLGQSDFNLFIQKVYEAFDKKVVSEVLEIMSDLTKQMPVGSPFVVTGQLNEGTKKTIDDLFTGVKGINDSEIFIMGTHSALAQLQKLEDVKWRSALAREEMYTTGRLSFFEGIPLVEIPQSVKLEGNQIKQLIPNDFLYVIPRNIEKFVKITNYGDPEAYEVTERGARIDDTIKFEYSHSFGVNVFFPRYMGIIKITE